MASSSAKALPVGRLWNLMEQGQVSFNGLLIGQGTAGHRIWTLVVGAFFAVSMASSSAKALPDTVQPPPVAATDCFNGLLIGQGTAG